jgi:aminopeptidase N
MSYVIGKENFDKGMLRLWNDWKFNHPSGTDVIRTLEKVSGMELDWYYDYFISSTKTIDYGIVSVQGNESETRIGLERKGLVPMPVDLVVTYQDGSQEMIYLPLVIQRGEKPEEVGMPKRILSQRWPWTNPVTEVKLGRPISEVKSVEIDPSMRLADINRENNRVEVPVELPKK